MSEISNSRKDEDNEKKWMDYVQNDDQEDENEGKNQKKDKMKKFEDGWSDTN